ncbi:unnamed protein product [[Candida] boidinii]|uniref:Unnamed protein product n=1 Tax=Candida boidinii TaxID=5477 RepID=A0A9W6WHG7_CANBO|nr:unnamed protein product [[Candida] boidinii]
MSYQEGTKRRRAAGSTGKDENIAKRQSSSVRLQKNNHLNTNKNDKIYLKDKKQSNSSNTVDNRIHNKYKKLLNKIENQSKDPIKPREEIDFESYYPDLDPNEPLQVLLCDDESESITAENLELINNYTNLKKITDESVMSGLRKANFREIPQKDYSFDKFFTDPEDKNNLFAFNHKLTEKDTEFGYHSYPIAKEKESREFTISDQQNEGENENSHKEYIRSDNISGSLISNTLLPENISSKFQTLYDMDECDLFFLKYINKHRINLGLNAITMEIFETTITFLENESYFLEKLSIPTLRNQVIDEEKAIIRASLYGSDDGTGCAPEPFTKSVTVLHLYPKDHGCAVSV